MRGESTVAELPTSSGIADERRTTRNGMAPEISSYSTHHPGLIDPDKAQREKEALALAGLDFYSELEEPANSPKLNTTLAKVGAKFQGNRDLLTWRYLRKIAVAEGRDIAAQCHQYKKEKKKHPEISEQEYEDKMDEFDRRIMEVTSVFLVLKQKVEKDKLIDERYEKAALNEYVAIHRTRYELGTYTERDPDKKAALVRNVEIFSAFQKKLSDLPAEEWPELAEFAAEEEKNQKNSEKKKRKVAKGQNRGEKPDRREKIKKFVKRHFTQGGRLLTRPGYSPDQGRATKESQTS